MFGGGKNIGIHVVYEDVVSNGALERKRAGGQ